MKKLILTIVLILITAACALSFSACSNATVEGQLEDVWRPYESYVYDVSAPNSVSGIYTVTVSLTPAGTDIEDFGGEALTNVKKGYLVSGKLEVGTTEFLTKCYFALIDGSNYLTPVASYRKQTVDGTVTTEVKGNYNGADFNYSGTVDSKSVSGSIKLAAPFYDNNEFHQTLRGANIGTDFSFSFNIPVVGAETAAIKLSANCKSVESVSAPYFGETERECYKIIISRSTKVAGETQSLYYAKGDVTVDGWALNDVLVKIVEPTVDGDVVYTLKAISLAE